MNCCIKEVLLMSRQAPTPSVRFIMDPQTPEDGKILRNNLTEAHLMAVRGFLSSLNLCNTDMEAMKELLRRRRTIPEKGGAHETG